MKHWNLVSKEYFLRCGNFLKSKNPIISQLSAIIVMKIPELELFKSTLKINFKPILKRHKVDISRISDRIIKFFIKKQGEELKNKITRWLL